MVHFSASLEVAPWLGYSGIFTHDWTGLLDTLVQVSKTCQQSSLEQGDMPSSFWRLTKLEIQILLNDVKQSINHMQGTLNTMQGQCIELQTAMSKVVSDESQSDLPWPHHMSQLLLLWREGDTTTGQPLHLSLEIELQTPSKTTEPFNTPKEFMMHTLRGRRNRITPSTLTKTQRRRNYPTPRERERVTSIKHSQKVEVEEALDRWRLPQRPFLLFM
ncbi:uncharacterized protein LOC116362598 isoform X1 [Oncorhynchus kisutch]|uniref:uncharacterized protein LOC116356978 isoform X1 n=1 Tax=Oncorhynchus kisutch TaxID=8019 RepID=UPI0012DBE827|nr:uncharacterized protein LOC116356978 isoform X1 [Oncorhynchus kisutch]XP_031672552.1 uncharacterized protein LOC116362598 isoform X1 [Oncorhynchus kisutch]